MLDLNLIRTNGGTQSREELHEETYLEYAEAMLAGATFPPVTVFHDGANYWLADGFHRFFGAQHAGIDSIAADVRQGTQADAQLFSYGANGSHGLRRSNADKRRAVTGALKHPVSAKWSDNQIAKHCGVSQPFVSSVRASLQTVISEKPAERTYTTKHGTEAVMKTAKIGKAAPAPAPAAPPPAAPPAASVDDEPEDDGPSASEIAFLVESEQADRDAMQKLLDADDKLAEAFNEIKRLNAEVAQLRLARDGYMNKSNEMIRTIKSMQRKIDKLEKVAA